MNSHPATLPIALTLIASVALIAGVVATAWHFASAPAPDRVEEFLSQHWRDPLPPQGVPPVAFSPLEASLAPESCAQCHEPQYRDWHTSLHSQAMGAGILWQLALMQQSEANGCLRCHAPLAEQKALLAQERGWSGPATAPPGYVPDGLHRGGLVCAACHVRSHQRFGPRAAGEARSPSAHAGFVVADAFSDSRFCATCHQFAPDGRRLNGKLLENTYEEWRASGAAQEDKSCQHCHMPERRHLWRGIHDPEMARSALTADLRVLAGSSTARVSASVRNTGAGHYFPTYIVPEIEVLLEWTDGKLRKELARGMIARRADVALENEQYDTRLAPGAALTLSADLPTPSKGRIELRMRVAPGAHYERLYASMLNRRNALPMESLRLLETAAAEARTKRYELLLAAHDLDRDEPLQIARPASRK